MTCSQCAAATFSAAAKTLVERGYRCPNCGGELALAPTALALEARMRVGVAAEAEGESDAAERELRERARRFDRAD